ncbi:hypothetical protein RHSIM_RhsimUnG0107900 [Rhododendron simsii]|uniref:Uncharacterized protein n=1 Tax=Rhododendron simsii TaxID=118357 RepID=A0A834FVB5_RHOSS|nr:hypothetical protein RHSIM_RhsimUnG0107900 [Rhododendron simsii]
MYWYTANHLVIFAAITALATLVILMTQNQSESPLDSCPVTMAFIAISLFIYGVGAALTRDIVLKVQQQRPRRLIRCYFWRIVNILVHISGVVCLFSITSLFISDGLGWIIYVICAGILCVLLAVWDIVWIFQENMNSAPVA